LARPFTYAEKLAAVEREIKLRRRVYPTRVTNGRMTQRLSDEQIAVMEAIAGDYRKAAAKERLL
jgi:hypothetical protein